MLTASCFCNKLVGIKFVAWNTRLLPSSRLFLRMDKGVPARLRSVFETRSEAALSGCRDREDSLLEMTVLREVVLKKEVCESPWKQLSVSRKLRLSVHYFSS